MVIDPHALVAEIERLRAQGIVIDRSVLRIADNATLILSLHRELDAVRENSNTGTKIGTTKRGIGPAYEDKVGRRAIRVMDLANLKTLPEKIDRLLSHHNPLRRGLGYDEIDPKTLFDELDVSCRSDPALPRNGVEAAGQGTPCEGKPILFEGAQGALLDIDHGTYPFVTSSNTIAGQAAAGSGLGPGAISYVLGITKAYTTRVGEGPFPTEQLNETGAWAWRTRPRIRHCHGPQTALRLVRRGACASVCGGNGITGIALTKLDILDGMEEIKICTGYRLDGEEIAHLPASQGAQAGLNRSMNRSMAGKARRRAHGLGRTSGAGHQICSPDRGIDRRAHRAAVHQPGA